VRTSLLATAVALLLSSPAAGLPPADTAAVQALLDQGRGADALKRLDAALTKNPNDAAALRLRASARFMEGEFEAGKADLERSLALDPGQRQAWLDRAGVAIAEERYAAALTDLGRARELDPAALDNDLNEGAVLLLLGRLGEASSRFERYLERSGANAEAFYLVATNYAGRGYGALAASHLARAVAVDERARLRARTDPNFEAIAQHADFRSLLERDDYRPPTDALQARRSFPGRYDASSGPLLLALLDALRAADEAFDPRVESTANWALVWGELRFKVRDLRDGDGTVSGEVAISAPAGTRNFDARVKKILDGVTVALLRRSKTAGI
jgi:tetratricopeptide (TPR) repeat protein